MTIGLDFRSLACQTLGRYARWAWRLTTVVAVLALSLGLGLRPAAAQTPLTLATLHISLWPEFDRTGVLVIMDGSLTPGTPLPATISLRMPAAAGQPNATAYRAADGSFLTAPFTTATADSAIIVTFSIETLDFRLEYYDPALAISGDQRTYTFSWISGYAVTAAAVRLQQPAGASAFTTVPALTATGTGEYGLEYYEGSLGALTAGQVVQVSASYTKPDTTLSSATVVAAAPVATPAPTPAAGTGSSASTTLLIAAVVGVALIAVGVVVFFMLRGRADSRSRRAPRRHRGRASQREPLAARQPAAPRLSTERFTELERRGYQERQAAAKAAAKTEPPPAFCTQCGQRRQPGDQFCRQCGAPVKT